MSELLKSPDELEKGIQIEIMSCFQNLDEMKSFFLYAGAGSGKTHTLVEILKKIKEKHKEEFLLKNKQVKVITYTNVATEEIIERIEQDSLFNISTIHSFCWDLICEFTIDIKDYLKQQLKKDTISLQESQQKARGTNTAAYRDREISIKRNTQRLERLESIIKFNYSPDPQIIKTGFDALSHQEVLNITQYFLKEKCTFQKVLINKYPIIFIDESQDTFAELIEELIKIETIYPNFSLGLFGDTMQRIYLNGHKNLEALIPGSWLTPEKTYNRRSKSRIIELGNTIRKDVDRHQQKPITTTPKGYVHLFLTNHDYTDKAVFEKNVCVQMGEICNDLKWNDQREIKTFLLEHQMASIREGFKELYASLNTDKLASGLRDGTLPELNIFTKHIAPILQARSENNHQLVMNLLQNYNSNYFKENPSINTLKNISMLIESMFSAYQDNSNITFLEILRIIGQSSIFEIPNRLKDIMILSKGQKIANIISNIEEDKESDKITLGLAKFLNTPFKQAYSYQKYINEETSYTTHHNV